MGKNLITLEDFKTYKGITSSENDSKISSIILYVSDIIKQFCARSFIDYYTTDKIEFHGAKFNNTILLDEFPVLSITSVEYSSDGGNTLTELEEYIDYAVDYELGAITSMDSFPLGNNASIDFNNIKVTYKAGYSKVPESLKIATMDLVEYYREEEFTPRKAFQGMTIENLGFREGGSAMPSHIARVLNLYRRIT